MGRMLETLKTLGHKIVPQDRVAQECVVDWSLREAEEVPYIEVGAGKKIEGSPQVMAVKHPAQATVQPPHPATEKTLADVCAPKASSPLAAPTPTVPATVAVKAPAQPLLSAASPARQAPAAKVVALIEPKPLGIAFERWPAAVPTGRGLCPEAIAYHDPAHPISKQYAELLDKMLADSPSKQATLLCGAKAQVGTTTVLLNLGIVAAQGKRRPVLIDAQLARPSLAERLGLTPRAGLQEAIEGNAALDAIVLKTAVAGLHLVAARAEDNAAVGTLTPEGLAWALAWLKERHDLLLIDGPTLDDTADLGTLAPLCDGIYLVAQQGSVQPSKAIAQSISRQGGRMKGLIHTQFEI